jgi:hypothetical protein
VALLAEIGQVLIALAFSAAVARWLGPLAYVVVAIAVFVTCGLLLFEAERRNRLSVQLTLEGERGLVLLALTMAGTAFVFGTIWPALPPILVWSAWRRRHGALDEKGAASRE